MVIDEPDNYKEDMQPNIVNDKVIEQKQLNKITKDCNDATKSLMKILGFGKSSQQENRVLSNAYMTQYYFKLSIRPLGRHQKIKPAKV